MLHLNLSYALALDLKFIKTGEFKLMEFKSKNAI
jgi:hypothetical protein